MNKGELTFNAKRELDGSGKMAGVLSEVNNKVVGIIKPDA